VRLPECPRAAAARGAERARRRPVGLLVLLAAFTEHCATTGPRRCRVSALPLDATDTATVEAKALAGIAAPRPTSTAVARASLAGLICMFICPPPSLARRNSLPVRSAIGCTQGVGLLHPGGSAMTHRTRPQCRIRGAATESVPLGRRPWAFERGLVATPWVHPATRFSDEDFDQQGTTGATAWKGIMKSPSRTLTISFKSRRRAPPSHVSSRSARVARCLIGSVLAIICGCSLVVAPISSASDLAVGHGEPVRAARAPRTLILDGATSFGGMPNPGSLQQAISRFGRPTTLESDPADCRVRWSELGITALFQDFGASASGTPCHPARSFELSEAVLSGSRWSTERGLRLGAPLADLQRLYPHAVNPPDCATDRSPESSWWELDNTRDELGGPGSFICTLSAIVKGGIVTKFQLSSRAASE
jgi:hypothetical protein